MMKHALAMMHALIRKGYATWVERAEEIKMQNGQLGTAVSTWMQSGYSRAWRAWSEYAADAKTAKTLIKKAINFWRRDLQRHEMTVKWVIWRQLADAAKEEREYLAARRLSREAKRLHPRVPIEEQVRYWPFNDEDDEIGFFGGDAALEEIGDDIGDLEKSLKMSNQRMLTYLKGWRRKTIHKQAALSEVKRAAASMLNLFIRKGWSSWIAYCAARKENEARVREAVELWSRGLLDSAFNLFLSRAVDAGVVRRILKRSADALELRLTKHGMAKWKSFVKSGRGGHRGREAKVQSFRESKYEAQQLVCMLEWALLARNTQMVIGFEETAMIFLQKARMKAGLRMWVEMWIAKEQEAQAMVAIVRFLREVIRPGGVERSFMRWVNGAAWVKEQKRRKKEAQKQRGVERKQQWIEKQRAVKKEAEAKATAKRSMTPPPLPAAPTRTPRAEGDPGVRYNQRQHDTEKPALVLKPNERPGATSALTADPNLTPIQKKVYRGQLNHGVDVRHYEKTRHNSKATPSPRERRVKAAVSGAQAPGMSPSPRLENLTSPRYNTPSPSLPPLGSARGGAVTTRHDEADMIARENLIAAARAGERHLDRLREAADELLNTPLQAYTPAPRKRWEAPKLPVLAPSLMRGDVARPNKLGRAYWDPEPIPVSALDAMRPYESPRMDDSPHGGRPLWQ